MLSVGLVKPEMICVLNLPDFLGFFIAGIVVIESSEEMYRY